MGWRVWVWVGWGGRWGCGGGVKWRVGVESERVWVEGEWVLVERERVGVRVESRRDIGVFYDSFKRFFLV